MVFFCFGLNDASSAIDELQSNIPVEPKQTLSPPTPWVPVPNSLIHADNMWVGLPTDAKHCQLQVGLHWMEWILNLIESRFCLVQHLDFWNPFAYKKLFR